MAVEHLVADTRLDQQIDYIVYSSGFPYAVNLSADLPKDSPKMAGRVGSLTGLTFFNVAVRSRSTSYLYTQNTPRSNFYVSTWTRGFRSHYGWNARGQRVNPGGSAQGVG